MNPPQHSTNLKDLEPGYIWSYRGIKWQPGYHCTYAVLHDDEATFKYYNGLPAGTRGSHYYEKVKIATPTLEDKIQRAKDLIGKKVLFTAQSIGVVKTKVASWHVTSTTPPALDERSLIYKYLQDNDACVYVVLGNNSHVPVDSERLEVIVEPEYKEVDLNGSYTAKVYKDKIEVGCQTFNVSILEELIQAHKELK
jgi:hypothetical protein